MPDFRTHSAVRSGELQDWRKPVIGHGRSPAVAAEAKQNGISEAGELKTLFQADIASIGAVGAAINITLGNGNTQPFSGSFKRANGTSGDSGTPELSGSLLLAPNNFYREFTDDPAITEEAQALTQMGGSGGVRNLREAMNLASPFQAVAIATALLLDPLLLRFLYEVFLHRQDFGERSRWREAF